MTDDDQDEQPKFEWVSPPQYPCPDCERYDALNLIYRTLLLTKMGRAIRNYIRQYQEEQQS